MHIGCSIEIVQPFRSNNIDALFFQHVYYATVVTCLTFNDRLKYFILPKLLMTTGYLINAITLLSILANFILYQSLSSCRTNSIIASNVFIVFLKPRRQRKLPAKVKYFFIKNTSQKSKFVFIKMFYFQFYDKFFLLLTC